MQATWIRNSILHALRTTDAVNTRGVPQTFVYQHPTILAMSIFINPLLHQRSRSLDDAEGNSAVARMLAMVSKYTEKLPQHVPDESAGSLSDGDVVLLTGTTGGLGCNILAALAGRADVKRVFALNRSSTRKSLLDRQRDALLDRGLDVTILESTKIILLEGATLKTDLGLSEEVLTQVSLKGGRARSASLTNRFSDSKLDDTHHTQR